MDPAQHSVPFEDGQIPPDRLGGDVQCLGEGVDVDPSCGAGAVKYVLLALLCIHMESPEWHRLLRHL